MTEVICESCQERQEVDVVETVACTSCGSKVLTSVEGYCSSEPLRN